MCVCVCVSESQSCLKINYLDVFIRYCKRLRGISSSWNHTNSSTHVSNTFILQGKVKILSLSHYSLFILTIERLNDDWRQAHISRWLSGTFLGNHMARYRVGKIVLEYFVRRRVVGFCGVWSLKMMFRLQTFRHQPSFIVYSLFAFLSLRAMDIDSS